MGEEFTLGAPTTGEDGDAPRTYELIPEKEILAAEVLDAAVKVMPYKDKETGDEVKKVVFKFKVMDSEYEDRWVWGETSTSFVDHPGCRLRAWVGELLGTDVLPEGFSFNTDDLLDQSCRIVIGVRSWDDKTTGVKQYRNFVADVLRPSDGLADTEFEPF